MRNTTHTITKTLNPGLYRLNVDGDAREFNWEELYVVLNVFNNKNQRTGPWDFSLGDARPLLPAYWVYVNDRKIGLWYFNRPSAAQIQDKRFKGEASFWIREAGTYEFRFEPYRDFKLTWETTDFGIEPDDQLQDTLSLRPEAERGFQRLFDKPRWDNLATRLKDPSFPYHALFAAAVAWAGKSHQGKGAYGSMPLPLLAADYALTGNNESLGLARDIIEHLLSLPAWGNPKEDGYGHNGDMGAAGAILDLTVAINFLDAALEKPLRERVLARLERQIDVYLEMALLHRGYWGGSILQDHGFRSFSWLLTAVYALVGWTPKTEEWLRFCLPRMQRMLRALPTDGVIPQTSYHLIVLYADAFVLLRELHKQATLEDVYERPAWRNVSNYAFESYVPEIGKFLHVSLRGDLTQFCGGHAFFDQMARTFSDAEAAWLSREFIRIVSAKGLYHIAQEQSMWAMTLWAALLWEPIHLPSPERLPRRLRWFKDTGAIIYRHDATGILLSAHCGPPNGLTAIRNTTGPCDRMVLAPVSGTFAITRRGLPLIQNAEGGYKMRTELGNVVLVDGQGQLADHAPPMSCVNHPYAGELIADVCFDEQSGRGRALMILTKAYDPSLGITNYTREFRFEADGCIRLVDTIAASRPHRFTWLFHTFKSHPITSTGEGRFAIQARNETLTLQLAKSSSPLRSATKDTLVVWGYCNENQDEAFQHLEFETEQPVINISVEYVLK